MLNSFRACKILIDSIYSTIYLEAGVEMRAALSGSDSGAPCIKFNQGDSWGKAVSIKCPDSTT
jgi:hypothetical protein